MPKTPPTTRARALLRRMLRRGARPARAVMAEAERRGIAAWALRKAKTREDVASTREGFGRRGEWMWEPSWQWELPNLLRRSRPAPGEENIPPPPRCAWQGCTDAPRSPRARYCAAHARLSIQENKRTWKRRHKALVREAMARLAARRHGSANGGAPESMMLLEAIRAARQWLLVKDQHAASRGVQANLDVLERLLTGGHGAS